MEYISSLGQHERARKTGWGNTPWCDLPSQALREPACDDIAQQRHRGPHCGGVGREARAEESPLASSHSPHFSFSYGFRSARLMMTSLPPRCWALSPPGSSSPPCGLFLPLLEMSEKGTGTAFFADLWHTFRFGPPPVLSTGVHQFVLGEGWWEGRRNARHS